MKYIYLAILSFISLFTISCSTFFKSESEIVKDTVFIQISDDGEITYVDPTPGLKKTSALVLKNNYDYVIFNSNEKIKLVVDGIDFCETTLKIEKFDDNEKIKITVVPIDEEIILENKCQVQKWYDPYELPKISVNDKIINGIKAKDQQIVITPIYNKNCERIGFQIRYGSIERGCIKEGRKILNEFNKCNGNPRIKGKKPVKLVEIFC